MTSRIARRRVINDLFRASLLGVGGRAPRIREGVEPSGECLSAVGLDLRDGQRGSCLIVNYYASANDDAPTPSASERQPVGTR